MGASSVRGLFRQKLEECCAVMRRMARGAFSLAMHNALDVKVSQS